MIGRKYFCRKKTNTTCILGVCLILLSLWKFGLGNDVETDNDSDSESALFSNGYSRHLLTVLPNCTPRAIEQFPRDVFNMHQRRSGAVTLHIVAAVYMFLGFALLCDDYFVPSLEVLCDVLHIQSDVAGATFMAAGSSAPELATAIIAVFIAKDDIGVGTVVGSAVYNVMFVISVCALFAGMVIHLSWYPLVRDCVVYAISVLALAWVIHDEKVYWYEALVFLFMYFLYIVLMYFNTSLEIFFNKHLVCCNHRNQAMNGIPLAENGLVQREKNGNIKDAAFVSLVGIEEFDSDFEEEIELDEKHPFISDSSEVSTSDTSLPSKNNDSSTHTVFSRPDACWKVAVWVVALPLKVVFYLTIPDCRRSRWQNWFIVTFIMSLVWLSVLSYLMVWMITIIGYTAGISDTIMGLTLIAFGVSLPDVISSLLVVREGLGDMAVANAVGSNVFDILVCLGVPWLLKSAIRKGQPVQVYSEGLLYATFTLLGTVVFLLAATYVNGWKLTKKYGVVLMVVYVLFTVLTSLYELNIFGYVHPKECVSSYER